MWGSMIVRKAIRIQSTVERKNTITSGKQRGQQSIKTTYRDALKEALREEMLCDETVFLVGEDIAEYGDAYKVTDGLWTEVGKDRVRLMIRFI